MGKLSHWTWIVYCLFPIVTHLVGLKTRPKPREPSYRILLAEICAVLMVHITKNRGLWFRWYNSCLSSSHRCTHDFRAYLKECYTWMFTWIEQCRKANCSCVECGGKNVLSFQTNKKPWTNSTRVNAKTPKLTLTNWSLQQNRTRWSSFPQILKLIRLVFSGNLIISKWPNLISHNAPRKKSPHRSLYYEQFSKRF